MLVLELDLHTGRPLTQSHYTRSCIHTIVPLRTCTKVLEKVEDLNKYIIENLCVNLVIYQNYTKMHGQKNIKF
jgi:hypothetical protein